MLLQPDQPQVRLLVLLLLRGGAQLLVLVLVHPARQPDDRQGQRLLLHALRQLLQEHHNVRQLQPQHQVLETPNPLLPPSVFLGFLDAREALKALKLTTMS